MAKIAYLKVEAHVLRLQASDFVRQFSGACSGPPMRRFFRIASLRIVCHAAVPLDGEGNVLFGPKLQKDLIAAHEKNGTMLLRKLLKSREGMRQWAG